MKNLVKLIFKDGSFAIGEQFDQYGQNNSMKLEIVFPYNGNNSKHKEYYTLGQRFWTSGINNSYVTYLKIPKKTYPEYYL
jgi:hypothetical protein